MLSILTLLLLYAGLALAHTRDPNKICKDYIIPLTVTSGNYIWGLPTLETDYDVTTFTTNLSRWDANVTFHPVSGFSPQVTASYKIAGTFCAPTKGPSTTVLVASHGLGFDRRSVPEFHISNVSAIDKIDSYWHPEIQPERYSFVDHSISKGYSVFFYDRLGVSKSSVYASTPHRVQHPKLTDLLLAVSPATSTRCPSKSPFSNN